VSNIMAPLPVHPWPISAERMALLREAKTQLDTDLKVLPVEAVPGSEGRILAFGEVPPFFSETVLIRPENTEKVESVMRALEFWLTAPEGTEGSFTSEMWLAAAFGVPVTYRHSEDETGKVFWEHV